MKTQLKYLEYKLTTQLERNRFLVYEDLKEKELHVGKVFAIEFGLGLISETLIQLERDLRANKEIKEEVKRKFDMKINSTIYNLIRSEESYEVKKTERVLRKIWRYDGMITKLQELRVEVMN